MNYDEAVSYLYQLGHETLAMKLGLESVRRLASAAGDPQNKLPAVHIAGTNGKGSSAAMTAAIADAAGLRVGLYTSPHLVEITERIRIGGVDISAEDFARLAGDVRDTGERLVAAGDLPALPTFFEQVTVIGFLYFAEKEVDLAVLEVGLGGRLDATNICRPVVTAITPVGEDHQQYLGSSLASIAGEKAGIIKPSVPVVSSPQLPEVMEVIRARSAEVAAPLVSVEDLSVLTVARGSDGFYSMHCKTERDVYDVSLTLRGRHQTTNAQTAIHIAEQLHSAGFAVEHPSIIAGLGQVVWPGRLEMVRTSAGRDLLLDGAHNPDGARCLRAFLDEQFSGVPLTMMFGAMSDKPLAEMAQILFPAATTVIATRIANPRTVEPLRIEELALGFNRSALRAESAAEALAVAERTTPAGGLICAAGSLYLVGELEAILDR